MLQSDNFLNNIVWLTLQDKYHSADVQEHPKKELRTREFGIQISLACFVLFLYLHKDSFLKTDQIQTK